MCFRCLSAVALVVLSVACAAPPSRVLRVCGDPNNLPFSNNRLEGFENRLADLVARELDARVEYTWWAQRRGHVRNTIEAGTCDVLMGVPRSSERTLVTRAYYRSSYVFLTRRDDGLRVTSLDDPVLRQVRIGVQLIGDDGGNTPPALALASRRITNNIVGYTVYGNYSEPNPLARIVNAVAKRDVDVAVVWGPTAGYFARREPVPLELTPVNPEIDRSVPFAFEIAIGVARGAPALRDAIDAALERRRSDVDRLLDDYDVPRLPDDF